MNIFRKFSILLKHPIKFPHYYTSAVRFASMKYILVTGGVISGIGKGVIASSLGTLLKSQGIKVTSIKIDPYINIDAGTFSPYEHGEVFVLDDGGEVDLDLGNYERFLDITLNKDNNITTGKIYANVIAKERSGDYLGKTVQVVPHITDAIQEWVENVAIKPVTADGTTPEVCIIELGGTIGDIEGMQFVEAFRQFQFRVKRENFCCVHVSLIIQPKATGEHKTKPTQANVRELRGLGLSPDFIICRSEKPVTTEVKDKVSNFCHVSLNQVICIHDVPSIYHVPLLLEEQNVVSAIANRLNLKLPTLLPKPPLYEWQELASQFDSVVNEVKIALVGKYTQLKDSYTSVTKALQHASLSCNMKLNLKFITADDLEPETERTNPVRYHEAWHQLHLSDGVIVPGGFGNRGIEGKIAAITWARKTSKPFLGVCLGLQCAVIEFARNVLEMKDANSQEVDPESKNHVVIEMPEHNPEGQLGGTMRLGKKRTYFNTDKSILRTLYCNADYIEERHRHRYEVNPKYVPEFEAAGMKFVGQDEHKERMEVMELEGHPYFVGVQYHPEYISRPLKPSPPYLGLILASSNKLNSYLSKKFHLTVFNETTTDVRNGFQKQHVLKSKSNLVNGDINDVSLLENKNLHIG
ncbi:CTP synthase 1-like isoform X1 [Centruroides sculpturatus]|uniref:CTP synthase 1-like isoform X1 n=2 Tax=Centruroides sculpturatus TaxID=218467 RepID=UPI000C6D2C57|nr:CTP synthase 1-like isoform X1 [Centruroides sculpturatus]